MFSLIANTLGKIVGETSTQIGKAYDDVCDIPSAFGKGYDEEIFEASTEASTNTDTIIPTIPTTIGVDTAA